jgi:hypothetical protein
VMIDVPRRLGEHVGGVARGRFVSCRCWWRALLGRVGIESMWRLCRDNVRQYVDARVRLSLYLPISLSLCIYDSLSLSLPMRGRGSVLGHFKWPVVLQSILTFVSCIRSVGPLWAPCVVLNICSTRSIRSRDGRRRVVADRSRTGRGQVADRSHTDVTGGGTSTGASGRVRLDATTPRRLDAWRVTARRQGRL